MGTDSTCATVIDKGFSQRRHGEHRAPRGKDNEGLLLLFFIPVVPTLASIFLWIHPYFILLSTVDTSAAAVKCAGYSAQRNHHVRLFVDQLQK